MTIGQLHFLFRGNKGFSQFSLVLDLFLMPYLPLSEITSLGHVFDNPDITHDCGRISIHIGARVVNNNSLSLLAPNLSFKHSIFLFTSASQRILTNFVPFTTSSMWLLSTHICWDVLLNMQGITQASYTSRVSTCAFDITTETCIGRLGLNFLRPCFAS